MIPLFARPPSQPIREREIGPAPEGDEMISQSSVTITIQGPGGYRVVDVPSVSRPEERHKVLLACDCEGFRYRRYCRHLVSAADKLRQDAPRLRRFLPR